MIKGIYKEFITVKIKNTPIYEEAIFVLNRAHHKKDISQNELLFEANRILCESEIKKPRKKRRIFKKICFSLILLLLGGISGSVITYFLFY